MMRVFEQSINSGENFDGTDPTTTPAAADGVEQRWPIDDSGGLFDFALRGAAWLSVQLTLGGQTTWALTLVDAQGFEVVLWSGTDEDSFSTLEGDEIMINPGQTLELVTTGTTTNDCMARLAVRRVE